MTTRLQLECGRCLEPFEIPVDSPFELRYVPHAGRAAEGRNGKSSEDDLTTAFYKEDSIDLGELMHEQFVLALPMKPLCARDVQGAVPALRDEPEQGDLRLCAGWDRSAPGRSQGSD